MEKKYPPLPNLDTVDLKLLRVFLAIVRNGGFSAAQLELNINQPTISTHMSQLETRLGVRLCKRGRSGFQLTQEGERVYEAARKLFNSIEDFRTDVAGTRGELVGDLHIGVVDAIATNPKLMLSDVIAEFSKITDAVRLHFYVKSPQNLQKDIMEERIHIAIGPFPKLSSPLGSLKLTNEKQVLYCGRKHLFFGLPDDAITKDTLKNTQFAARNYWTEPQHLQLDSRAFTGDMEALALLILSGEYIGYLPSHYAKYWVTSGEMRPILVDELTYESEFFLAYRRDETNMAAQKFISIVKKIFKA